MTALLQLVVLVVLAFLANAAVGRRQAVLAFAGAYVLVGILLGPLALGLIDDGALPLLRPATSLSVFWLGLLFGIRLRAGALARLGVVDAVAALLETGLVLALVELALPRLAAAVGRPAAVTPLLALGLAVSAAASSQFTVRWTKSRLSAAGPTVAFLERITGADDLVPVLALLGVLVLHPSAAAPAIDLHWPWLGPLVAPLAGLLVGSLYVLAAGRQPSVDRAFIVLLGLVFLGSGAAGRLGLPEIVVGLAAGLAIAAAGEGRLLAQVVSATERPVALLLLVLVGSRLTLAPEALAIGFGCVVLRFAGKLLAGPLLVPLGGGTATVGLGLLGYGGLAVATASQIDLLYGGRVGATVLLAAAMQAMAGDLFGPIGLIALLRRRGEVRPRSSAGEVAAVVAGV